MDKELIGCQSGKAFLQFGRRPLPVWKILQERQERDDSSAVAWLENLAAEQGATEGL